MTDTTKTRKNGKREAREAFAAPSWADLLHEALTEPGIVSDCYRQFYGYSFGNRMLAYVQCVEQGITPGPIATFKRWSELDRKVRKGSKALALAMPQTIKRTEVDEQTGEEVERTWTRFVYPFRWFVLSQTEGEALPPLDMGEWSAADALKALDIEQTDFTLSEGNAMGYAVDRKVAINPLNKHPEKTLLHELAHIVLGHTAEGAMQDGERTARHIRELEAEAVAYLCSTALGSTDALDESRGYIQSWYDEDAVPAKVAQRIFKAADTILAAGGFKPASA